MFILLYFILFCYIIAEENDHELKLCDFGYAVPLSELQSQKEGIVGTPTYVSPEILRGDIYGVETDIWSLGVICYVLFVGYPPFYDENPQRMFKKIKEGKYHFHEEYWGNISHEAQDFTKRMLCVSQRDRWTAQMLMSHPWMLLEDEKLAGTDLRLSLAMLKKYNLRRKFKAAVDLVIAANRFRRIFQLKKNVAEELAKAEVAATPRASKVAAPTADTTKPTAIKPLSPNSARSTITPTPPITPGVSNNSKLDNELEGGDLRGGDEIRAVESASP